MIREFVPYELALKLKELGFDEPCFATYDEDKEFEIQDFEQNYDTFPSHIIAAPLFQQAFRWFREKCGLNSHIHQENRDEYSYCCGQGYSDEIGGYRGFETYEEAELACLTKLIEIVETRTK